MTRRGFILTLIGAAVAGCSRKLAKITPYSGIHYRSSFYTPPPRPHPAVVTPITPSVVLGGPPLGAPVQEFHSQILPRGSWADAEPLTYRLDPMGSIWRITVHHEGNPRPNYYTSSSDVAEDLRLIRKNHCASLHAGDIGYHYIIDRTGRIWEGRPLRYQGAHVGGEANVGNIGVMCLGNFDIQRPTDQQKIVLKDFVAYLMRQYRVPNHLVYTHQELKPTHCPGLFMQAYVNAVRPSLG